MSIDKADLLYKSIRDRKWTSNNKDIYEEVKTSMQALAVFFNQKLPVDHYTFIIYLSWTS
jgi:hypothetical protein